MRRITIDQGVLMVSTLVGIVMVVALGIWHLRNRRHPRWRDDRDARFYITGGYPLLAVGVYFLLDSANGSDWMWTLGCFWTLVAMTSFVYGFQLLNRADTETVSTVRGAAGDQATARHGERRLIGR